MAIESDSSFATQLSMAASAALSRWTGNRAVPALAKPAEYVGPVTSHLRRRTALVYAMVCLAGIAPTLLSVFGIAHSSYALRALGWSLVVPGGGFLAIGGWNILAFAATFLIFRGFIFVWILTGFLALPIAVWVLSAVASYAAADDPLNPYGQLAVLAIALGYCMFEVWRWRTDTKLIAATQKQRNAYMPAAIARHEQRQTAAQATRSAAAPELDTEALRAARYVFDLALQPVGKLEGFTRIDNIQAAALRYQLNFISYGLAQLQSRYTPNFHGYLNQAQRFAIESLTLPEVCGYWKYEYALGRFGWNPDPIGTRDNIMLTGWSAIALTTYAANTGDLRYQQPGALQFHPFLKSGKSYPHDAHSFVQSILWNLRHSRLCLYSCEPHWTFSICNVLAMSGLFPYDRVNGTEHAKGLYDTFMRSFDEEFVAADGNIIAFVSALTGLHRFSRLNPALVFANNLTIACYGNAVHPGISQRAYITSREEMLELANRKLGLKMPWTKQIDMGNYQRSPGYTLANIAQAAAEHGDEEVRSAALSMAAELLERTDDKDKLFYRGVSTAANIKLATATWARANDWRDLILVGPGAAATRGPVLSDCAYPDVLVARAISDGQDLDLVLYNGGAPGTQRLKIERLQPSTRYRLEGALMAQVSSAGDGSLSLDVPLDGRTPLRLVRLNG